MSQLAHSAVAVVRAMTASRPQRGPADVMVDQSAWTAIGKTLSPVCALCAMPIFHAAFGELAGVSPAA